MIKIRHGVLQEAIQPHRNISRGIRLHNKGRHERQPNTREATFRHVKVVERPACFHAEVPGADDDTRNIRANVLAVARFGEGESDGG